MEPLNYEYEYELKLKENINALYRDGLNDSGSMDKIKKWSKKYGFHHRFLEIKASMDDNFAIVFMKEPNKQGFHENLAAQYILSFPVVSNFKILPKSGNKALVIANGKIENFTIKGKKTKSIDFEWIIQTKSGKNIKCYASHKYTKEDGGSQDNQHNDLCHFMDQANTTEDENIIFFAICDGEYYQKMVVDEGCSRLELMNKNYGQNDKTKALTINQLYDELLQIIENI